MQEYLTPIPESERAYHPRLNSKDEETHLKAARPGPSGSTYLTRNADLPDY